MIHAEGESPWEASDTPRATWLVLVAPAICVNQDLEYLTCVSMNMALHVQHGLYLLRLRFA